MGLNYLQEQIQEEIDGEAGYRAKASECPEFDTVFTKMANQEREHAENLLAILRKQIDDAEEFYKHYKEKLNE